MGQIEAIINGERKVSIETRREKVRELLLDGQWHSTAEINSPRVGGSEGTRRLRELRTRMLFFSIEKRRHMGHDDWEYKISSNGNDGDA